MANETTTSTLDDLTNSSLVQPLMIAALSEQPGIAVRNCREFDLTGQPTNAAKIAVEHSYWGSANDRGAGVATAFNATEATALSNTAFSTDSVTCTAAEYGVATQLTDNTQEDSVSGVALLQRFMARMLSVLQLAIDDDYIALFSGLSQSVGVSGSAATVAQMLAAMQGIRTRGAVTDSVAYVLGNVTTNYIESALTTGTAAQFAMAADRVINYMAGANYGLDKNRQVMLFRGAPVTSTGLTDTANAGADEVSACVCATSQFSDDSGATTHGIAWKRFPRFETQRQAKARGTDIVMTARAGLVELQDGSGTNITTKST